MELLRILTLVYVAVLVLALAASLTLIWIYLRRIAAALGGAREALTVVAARTRPLPELLRPVNPLLERSLHDLQEADARLGSARERLDELAEGRGAGALARPAAGEE
jgi:hypothetical protein